MFVGRCSGVFSLKVRKSELPFEPDSKISTADRSWDFFIRSKAMGAGKELLGHTYLL
jgi:hypothetical protein